MDAGLVGRRAEAMKERIVRLAVEHQLATKYTSFVVVEERQGERRASGTPETRVVPVSAPAGWSLAHQGGAGMDDHDIAPGGLLADEDEAEASIPMRKASRPAARNMPPPGAPAPAAPVLLGRSRGAAAPPPPPSMPAPAPALGPEPTTGSAFQAEAADGAMPAASWAAPMERSAKKKGGILDRLMSTAKPRKSAAAPAQEGYAPKEKAESLYEQEEAAPLPALADALGATEDVGSLLGEQLANGLWAAEGTDPEPVRQARATARVLLVLLREGITSNHPLHGAQVKKAVDALLALAAQLSHAPDVAELALGVAWLVAGPRTRGRIEQAAKPLPGLGGRLGDAAALRQHVETLATR